VKCFNIGIRYAKSVLYGYGICLSIFQSILMFEFERMDSGFHVLD